MRFLSKREIKLLRKKLSSFDKDFLNILENIKVDNVRDLKIYIKENIPILFEKEEIIFPTLNIILKIGYSPIPWVKVDQGASEKVKKGANLYRPGIKEFSEFKEKYPVCILDEKDFPIAVGYSTISSEKLKEIRKGLVIKVVHHLNDFIFKLKYS